MNRLRFHSALPQSIEVGKPERILINATHLKAHRTAARLLKNDLLPVVSDA
jgi:putative transposase